MCTVDQYICEYIYMLCISIKCLSVEESNEYVNTKYKLIGRMVPSQ